MSADPILVLVLLVLGLLPVGWFVAEFRGGRAVRVGLGIIVMVAVGFLTWASTSLVNRLSYNAWYGGATGELIRTSLEQAEDGELERVLMIWRGLERQYRPTYENRGHYDELVEEAVVRMRGEVEIEEGSARDAGPFTAETWEGFWEDGSGYCIVISQGFESPFRIVQSGQPRPEVKFISVSEDYRVFKFQEGDRWRHTLTLRNKYEAEYEWYDLVEQRVWEVRVAHKLVRATDRQKAMTRQDELELGEVEGP